jgi:hypothetical protein
MASLRLFGLGPRVLIWSGYPDYCWRDIAGNVVTVTWKA